MFIIGSAGRFLSAQNTLDDDMTLLLEFYSLELDSFLILTTKDFLFVVYLM